jgi:hypothetical protein
MNDSKKSTSTISDTLLQDRLTQAREIARLTDWVKRVSRRPSEDLLCRGIRMLIERSSLRHGLWPACFGLKRAFAVVWQSPAVLSFINTEIWPTEPYVASTLRVFAAGRLLMDTGYRHGNPEFIFWAAAAEKTLKN